MDIANGTCTVIRVVALSVCLLLGPPAVGAAAAANAPVTINEIMANNRTVVRDPQRQYDDWVELYNAGAQAVDIGGMYLTDDPTSPTKWRLPPETILASQGYLVIWTDGDTAADGLHANFRLNDEGEEIALFASDGATLIDSLSFGTQYVDISYGRYPDGSDELRFMTVPTPATANVSVYDGIEAPPTVSHGSCLCKAPITVTIAAADKDATVYYTLNGAEPFLAMRGRPIGDVYTGPIQIARTTTLKAVAWRPGWRESATQTRRYAFVSSSLDDFNSPLPIAVIDTLGKGVSGSQTLGYGYFVETGDEGRATFAEKTDFGGRVGINVRGKSSGGFPKRQYHLETWDENNRDHDVSILGFPAESDWVLQGPYSDKSLMRNVLAYQWSNEIGRYAPRTRFIEMFLSTKNGYVTMNDYAGVYVFMEKIKIGPDRVDITEVGPGDNAEPEISGGYIVKKDKFDSDDVTFNTIRGQRLIYADPNGRDLTQTQRDWVRQFFNDFESALYGAGYQDAANGYARFIDVASFIDHHIIVELCKNIDGFRLSTYMFKDRNGKLNMGPVWDYNLSLGNADYLDGWRATGWYYNLISDAQYPYWRRLFQDPEFRLRYADRWFALRRDLFASERLVGIVEDYATLLQEPQARNFDRWPVLGRRVWPNWFIARTFREEIDWMKDWLATRLTWMDQQIAGEHASAPPAFSVQGGHVTPGFAVGMSSTRGTVYYTLDGSDPRTLTGPIDPTTNTILVPENAPKRVLVPTGPAGDAWRGGQPFDDTGWTLVTGTPGGIGYERSTGYENFISLDVQSQMYGQQSSCFIRVPFIFARPTSEIKTLTLRVRYDDGFIAYLNGVEVARKNFAGPPAWNSAANTQNSDLDAIYLEPVDISGFKNSLLRGNNVLSVQGLNLSSSSSDFLISLELVASSSDEVENPSSVAQYVGPVTISESTLVKARALSGSDWSALNEAVFAVGPVAESLRISEIMYHPVDPNDEFIELTNIGAETINLNLVKFVNGINFAFADFEMSPGDHCLVVKDAAAFEARYGLGFNIAGQYTGSLNNAGERIELQDAAGQIMHDFRFEDDWYDITDGLGFSLTVKDPATVDPNGLEDKKVWRPSAFSGGSPGFDDSDAVPALSSIVINELLANSVGGVPDWIELHNTTDQAIDIGGWFLSDDRDELTKYEIASGTTIPAGGYVVFDQDRHFGNEDDPGCHDRFALSRNGETVYLHSGADGALGGYSEQEKFDASEPRVSLGRYQKSTGTFNFVALSAPTPGAANAYPQVGPVVINEIMYHPYTPADAEYVELLNISDRAATLYDVLQGAPWRFTDDPDNPGIELLLPSDPPVTLAPGEHLVLVKDLSAFTSRFSMPEGVQVLAWGAGNLANGSEKIQLSKPGDEEADGTRHWFRVDRVVYSDGAHGNDFPAGVDPWPAEADGQGMSLSRIDAQTYGNDPANWQAAAPSPGWQSGPMPRPRPPGR
jgi:hypothetical protein